MLSYLRGSHTPLYASPEQKEGRAPDPRDDVHALGVIGYQLLTGRLDCGPGVDFVDHLEKAKVEQDVIRLLKKCVATDRNDRLATAGELATRLRPLLSSSPSPYPTQPVAAITLPQTRTNGLGTKLVLVPAGKFWMGGGGGEAGSNQVEIPYDFYIGIYPVTQEEWQAVMGSNPSFHKSFFIGTKKLFPVEGVSWKDAQVFLQKLNAREKTDGWVYRLPTEAEWEFACREGASSKKACSFHFYLDKSTNDLLWNQANFNNQLGQTSKVGSYQPNRLGIYDMHGNVWEWCHDAEGSERVIRGGSWTHDSKYCQAAYCGTQPPSDRFASLGLRLALVPSGR